MTENGLLVPIPQPKPHPIFKNLRDLDADVPILGFMNLARTLGPIYRLSFPGDHGLVIVSSRELVHKLSDERRFDKKVHLPLEYLRPIGGDGLFTAPTGEPNWGKAHRILMPAFGPFAVRGMFDPMLDIADQLLLRWERFGPDAVIDVVDNMTRLTLDTIALCAFDYRFNSLYRDEMHPFVGAMVRALREAGDRTRRFPFQTRLMVGTRRRFEEDVRYMHQVADELIAQRKRDPAAGEKKDLLGLMLRGRDPASGEGLSDENIRFQMVTFLIAGHETTSGLLSFALYLLLKNPHALQRARAQVDEVLGTEAPRVGDLSRLPYVEQVLKEALRLWPTAPAFARQPYADTVIGGKYRLGRGETALVLVPMLHRDPAVWGDDPERFDPDRFSPEAEAALPEDAYKPFGTGPRACIGRAFAMQEAQLVLALILQRFDLAEHDPAYQLRIKQTLTLKPEGFSIRARRRAENDKVTRWQGDKVTEDTAPPVTLSPGHLVTLSSSTPLLVLYGSNSGSAEGFARRIASDARGQGFAAELDTMDGRAGRLPTAGAVVVVTASYEGQPPDNAKQFVAWAEALEPGALDGVRFAVFGCGHRDWARTYQAVPKRVDAALEAAGASRVVQRGEADAGGDFFGDFEKWYGPFWGTLAGAFGRAARAPAAGPRLEVELVRESRAARLGQSELTTGVVVENRELVNMAATGARSKRHLEIQLPAGMTYRAGDYLAVLPANPWANVVRALNHFGFAPDQQVILHKGADDETALPTGYPVNVSEILAAYVELAQPATRKQIEALAAATPCPPERRGLEAVLGDPAYEQEILAKRVSVLDLLERTPSCALPFAEFLAMLPAMRARQYSISSSPLWNDRNCTLTVAVVDAPARSGRGRYLGAASNYLAHAEPGTRVSVAIRPSNAAFHPPGSLATPLILVCAGTGVAPFRGFIQERALRAAGGGPLGRALLFFGCDHPDVDFLYREEWEAWEEQGVVEVRPAFSAPGGEVRYAQHRLWQDRADVIELFRQGARIFVCGDAQRLLPGVRETAARIYREATGCTPEEAARWLADLERNHSRYYADVFT
jgi:cytochrome P450/NADPH-cytochrome P450 reductase